MNGLNQLSAWADRWAAWCGTAFVGSTIVFLVVLAITAIFLRKRAPQLPLLLYFLVLCKPFVPIHIDIPLPWKESSSDAVVATAPATMAPVPPAVVDEDHRVEPVEASLTYSPVTSDTPSVLPVGEPATVSQSPQPELSMWVVPFLFYCLVVLGLLIRFVTNQIRYDRLVVRAKTVSLSALPIDLEEACQRAGIASIPRVVEMDTESPAIWGAIRPTLILPTRLKESLSPESFRWAVMHELAHWKRRDIVFHAIQRLLTLAQFWNPIAWIANDLVNRYREQACDDMALMWCDRKSVSASEALMHVVKATYERSQRQRRLAATSLGVFSSGSRRVFQQRLVRLLDTQRPLREKLGAAACLCVFVAAAVLLPQLRAVATPWPGGDPVATAEGDSAEEPSASTSQFIAAKDVGSIELFIVGPNDEAVPNASVEIRPKTQEPWEILTGKFVRDATYGPFVETDAQGRLKLKVPRDFQQQLNFSIKAPGYGMFWAQWRGGNQSETLPSTYTVRLDAGQSVGGVIVDSEGKPIAGAKVHPSIEYKKRETDESQLGSGWRATTDEQGRWRCDFVPASYDALSVEIVHANFVPTRLSLPLGKYRLANGVPPSEAIEISRGFTLTGKVMDESGAPIQGAHVRAVFGNETRSTQTNEQGMYAMPGCPEGTQVVTVTASNFSPDQKVMEFSNSLPPLDFTLQPGNTIRVRVVDQDGNPQVKTRIFFRRWREDNYGKGLGMVHAYTDDNGIWEWKEAPSDSFVADVCPRGGVTIGDQVFTAREEEYLFKTIRELVISGTVTDAVTKQPIESFQVIPGLVWPNRTAPHWTRRLFGGRNGKFTLTENRMDALHAVRIEAAGYFPASSRFIRVDEGRVELQMELEPAEDIKLTVLRPDGSPAVGAEATQGVFGTSIQVQNGSFSSVSRRIRADDNGLMVVSPNDTAMRIVILDDAGYADIVVDALDTVQQTTLIPWASVSGKLMRGDQAAGGTRLTLTPHQSRPADNVIDVSWSDRVTTDPDGSFRFPRVRPGTVDIFQSVTTHRSSSSSRSTVTHRRQLVAEPGEQKTLTLGGDGFAVVGQAEVLIDDAVDVDWEFSTLSISPLVGERMAVPYPAGLPDNMKKGWYEQWQNTAPGKLFTELRHQQFLRSIANYAAKVNEDGSFRVDDVPAGAFKLTLQLDRRPRAGDNFNSARLAYAEVTFEIPEDHDRSTPLDLGKIELRP